MKNYSGLLIFLINKTMSVPFCCKYNQSNYESKCDLFFFQFFNNQTLDKHFKLNNPKLIDTHFILEVAAGI